MPEGPPIELIEEKLSQLQKLNYNQFFWWRRWTRKGKALHNYCPLIDKIKNGDYADSPYRWQIYYCDWEIQQKRIQFPEASEWVYETRLDRQRRRRLREDHEKYEKENLKQLQKDFLNTFRMDRDDYQRDVIEVGGTLDEFYRHCEMRYGKYNRPSTTPRRGRPPKIKIDLQDSPY